MVSKHVDDVGRPWYAVKGIEAVDSPALLVYRDRVAGNLKRIVEMAGGVRRVRPHMKTHKMGGVMRMQVGMGLDRVKCATIAEAELAAISGAKDVLLAYQPVGPKVGRLVELMKKYDGVQFGAIADDADAMRAMAGACDSAGLVLALMLDVDTGMHRSGVGLGEKAVELYRLMCGLRGVRAAGLHHYDGHLHIRDVAERRRKAEAGFEGVLRLRERLKGMGLSCEGIVAGGTPTFGYYAGRTDVKGLECSPGTCVLWDWGYENLLPDMAFDFALLVLGRVASKPGGRLLCVDMGHKSIASENPHPRVHWLGLGESKAVGHSEEHLVLEVSEEEAGRWKMGDVMYGVPFHVCPTCALYDEAVVVDGGEIMDSWAVDARKRRLTV